MACACGHTQEEHGGDVEYPGSTSCNAGDCDCIAYEQDDGDDGDDIDNEDEND